MEDVEVCYGESQGYITEAMQHNVECAVVINGQFT